MPRQVRLKLKNADSIFMAHKNTCLICRRIQLIRQQNPYFIKELKTGYVVLGDFQFFRGYTLFLCKIHKNELHNLSAPFRRQFLWEMSVVAEAVFKAFHPRKLNYELLGNTDRHLHWHIIPRHKNDPLPKRTIWNIDKKIRNAASTRPSASELKSLKTQLSKKLNPLIKKYLLR